MPDLLDFDLHLLLPVLELCWCDFKITGRRKAVLGVRGRDFEERDCRVDGRVGGCVEVLGCEANIPKLNVSIAWSGQLTFEIM
jgi:hypothetical protein